MDGSSLGRDIERAMGCLIWAALALAAVAFAVGYLASGCSVKVQSPIVVQQKGGAHAQ